MSWDPVWDDIHASRAWGKYPKEELIRFVARNYYSVADRKAARFLDLGCGYGSSTWFLAREGFSVDAIDGSAAAIERLRERLAAEKLSAALRVGDMLALPYAPGTFDCVIDVASIMCNDPDSTRRILEGVHQRLKPGGRFFSISATPASTGAGSGERVAEGTYRNLREGAFANTGVVRFSTEPQIRSLYSGFGSLQIDLSEYSLAGGSHRVSNWIIEGVKQ